MFRSWKSKFNLASIDTVAVVCFALVNLLGASTSAGVATISATGLKPHSATLNGVVEPNTENSATWFEWGAGTNYGEITAAQLLPAGTNGQQFSQALTGLTIG